MQKRRRFKQTISLGDRLISEAHRLREQADKATTPQERDRLLREAWQTETAAHVDQWLTSPGLQPPS